MLLNIQDIIAKGKGPGYERWAKVHNVKQMAETLLFLQDRDLRDYDKLSEKAQDASATFSDITKRQKELEVRHCTVKNLCGCDEEACNTKCRLCRGVDCTKVCDKYVSVACHKFDSPPYVCNNCKDRALFDLRTEF